MAVLGGGVVGQRCLLSQHVAIFPFRGRFSSGETPQAAGSTARKRSQQRQQLANGETGLPAGEVAVVVERENFTVADIEPCVRAHPFVSLSLVVASITGGVL